MPTADPHARFITHPVFRRPGFGTLHPLSTNRQAAVLDVCEALGWLPPERIAIAPLAGREVLERFHTGHYLDALEDACADMSAAPEVRTRYNLGTMECPLFEGLMERARASVGGAMLAARLALAGNVAFHPGGGTHHGRPDRASGFCYFNDPVFAVLALLDAGLDRVLYLDLDAHHGDGVEDAFAADPRVTLISIHEAGRWPGTGALREPPDDRILNIPVPRGLTDAEFVLLWNDVVALAIERRAPQAAVVTLGADGLADDPLSAMQLHNTTLWDAVDAVRARVPHVAILGGGGYNPWTTVRLWAGLWGRLVGEALPDVLPLAAATVLEGLTCDLVDDEERRPKWTTRLTDPQTGGLVRLEIRDLATRLAGRTR